MKSSIVLTGGHIDLSSPPALSANRYSISNMFIDIYQLVTSTLKAVVNVLIVIRKNISLLQFRTTSYSAHVADNNNKYVSI